MGRNFRRWLAIAATCSGGLGCVGSPDARYVYQDGQYGVIGIPRNTTIGKKDYREQAHELMTRHFPEGYEIVRAEEVVEGERTLDTARKVEVDSEPGVAALNQMIKVGKFARSTSLDQKDSIKITESRILYRRKPDGKSEGRGGFTALANLSPEFYIDPNMEVRKGLKEGLFLVKKDAAKLDEQEKEKEKEKKLAEVKEKDEKEKDKDMDGKADAEVQKAAHSSPR